MSGLESSPEAASLQVIFAKQTVTKDSCCFLKGHVFRGKRPNTQKVLQPLRISGPAGEQYSKHGETDVFKRLSPQGTY